MKITAITPEDGLWPAVAQYAENCSWRAGRALAQRMNEAAFEDWERVVTAIDGGKICGFCAVTKTDCIPDVPYTPYIGFVFVGEAFRGRRLSGKMIDYASAYLRSIGFDRAYLVSDHVNLYEKYGFEVIDRKTAPRGAEEKIYMRGTR